MYEYKGMRTIYDYSTISFRWREECHLVRLKDSKRIVIDIWFVKNTRFLKKRCYRSSSRIESRAMYESYKTKKEALSEGNLVSCIYINCSWLREASNPKRIVIVNVIYRQYYIYEILYFI